MHSEIFAKQTKCQQFDLENEGQGKGIEKWNLLRILRILETVVPDGPDLGQFVIVR